MRSAIGQDALWARYCTGAPRPRTPCELRYSRSQASVAQLAERYGLNEKTLRKWRKRTSVEDARMGPKEVHSSVLSPGEEAVCVAFRRHTLLPLDDCLYTLKATIPHLSRSALHRLFQRHEISRLPDMEGDKAKRSKFKRYPIGYVHIDIAEVRTEEGKLYLFVAIDRTIKEATVKRYHYADHDQLRSHLTDFIGAYNYARRLKTLRGLTPYEFIVKCWNEEPDRFRINPAHHIAGPNTQRAGDAPRP